MINKGISLNVTARFVLVGGVAALQLAAIHSPAFAQAAATPGYVDLNKNGRMDPYENPELSVAQRVDNLVSQMTPEELIERVGKARGGHPTAQLH